MDQPTRDLLLELRCEELPPKDVERAARSLERALGEGLGAVGLPPASTSAAWTPRRIAVWAHAVPARSPDLREVLKGPPEKIAFDADGKPTRAAEGFARKSGVAVEDLERAGGRLVAHAFTAGRPASEVVAELLPALPAKTTWRKSMRWGAPGTFARPVRGVVALLGADVVPCNVMELPAGRTTRGHPFLHVGVGEVELATSDRTAYIDALRAAYVLADPDERRDRVRELVLALEPTADVHAALLDENTNLVEWPTALVGRFDESYLELPERVPVTVMEHHQRFFSVRAADGGLAPRFVAVLDRDVDSVDTSRPGFERVLVPRLHDANFFLRDDRKRSLEAHLPALENVVYHRKLGTLREKTERLARLAGELAVVLGLGDETVAHARRAGLLAKCDLVTHMVGEFPELQGHVGSVYARMDGEPEAVCAAIDAQYRHRFEDGEELVPAALSLVLAESLDVLCQFGTKVKLPSGRADPFGVRRAALTFLDAAERWAPALGISDALALAGGDEKVAGYVDTRLRQRHRDAGARPDHLDAVPTYATTGELSARLRDLAELDGQESFGRLLEVAERCRNITKKSDCAADAVRDDLLSEPAERELHRVWVEVRETLPTAPARLSRDDVARVAAAVAAPLHTFFEQVFVNDDDLAVRGNRHALLKDIDSTLLRFADLCRIVTPGATKS